MKQSLYDITTDLLQIEKELVENPEAVEGVIEKWLEANSKLPDKIDGYASLIRSLAASEAMYTAEAAHHAAKAKTAANSQARLKNALKACMEALQVEELPGRLFKAKIVNNGGKQALHIAVPADELPAEYRLEQVTVIPLNEAIRTTLESGGDVPGCELLPRGKRVEIR